MTTINVKALKRIDHGESRQKGDVFPVSAKHAEQLIAKGLCVLAEAAETANSKTVDQRKTAKQEPVKREPKAPRAPKPPAPSPAPAATGAQSGENTLIPPADAPSQPPADAAAVAPADPAAAGQDGQGSGAGSADTNPAA